jgi:hypothetical protein
MRYFRLAGISADNFRWPFSWCEHQWNRLDEIRSISDILLISLFWHWECLRLNLWMRIEISIEIANPMKKFRSWPAQKLHLLIDRRWEKVGEMDEFCSFRSLFGFLRIGSPDPMKRFFLQFLPPPPMKRRSNEKRMWRFDKVQSRVGSGWSHHSTERKCEIYESAPRGGLNTRPVIHHHKLLKCFEWAFKAFGSQASARDPGLSQYLIGYLKVPAFKALYSIHNYDFSSIFTESTSLQGQWRSHYKHASQSNVDHIPGV